MADAGLAMSDGRCLTAIGSFAPLSVNDLAQKANLNNGQASRAARSLVDQGLVRKVASPTDGRGVVLTLTAEGDSACRSAMQVVARRNQEIFGVLSDAGREQLSTLFDRLIDTAQASGTPLDEADG